MKRPDTFKHWRETHPHDAKMASNRGWAAGMHNSRRLQPKLKSAQGRSAGKRKMVVTLAKVSFVEEG